MARYLGVLEAEAQAPTPWAMCNMTASGTTAREASAVPLSPTGHVQQSPPSVWSFGRIGKKAPKVRDRCTRWHTLHTR